MIFFFNTFAADLNFAPKNFFTMKASRYLLFPVFSFVFLGFFAGCHLEETPDFRSLVISNCTTTPPEAAFSFAVGGNCDRPCTVTVTNTSSANSTNFFWRFGSVSTSTDKNPAPVTFPEAGDFEIMLIAQNAEGCADTVKFPVKVNVGISKFAKPIPVSTGNVTPYCATERADGKFHVLYGQGGVKSVLVNTLGNQDGLPAPIASANISAGFVTVPDRGGFVLAGFNGSLAKVKAVSSSQLLGIDPAAFSFEGAAESYIQGACINSDFDVAVTGYRKTAAGKYAPCFAKINESGAVVSNFSLSASVNDGYAGQSIAQRPSGAYLVLSVCQAGGCASDCQILSVASGGGYNSKKNVAINFPIKILRTTNDNYVVIGYTSSGTVRLVGINSSMDEKWRREDFPAGLELSDAAVAADGQLVLIGTLGNSLYFSKIPDAQTGTPAWTKPFTLAGTSLRASSIVRTADNGFLLLGSAEKDGKFDLYLAKTDADGNSN